MRAYDCKHEDRTYHLTGKDDVELFNNLKIHLNSMHADLNMTDDQIRETITANAYNE